MVDFRPARPAREPWGSRGSRLKIRDKERVEPPHVTLFFQERVWRFGLRDRAFLDDEPPAREVPKALVRELGDRIAEFTAEWDRLYPDNPVSSPDSD